MKKRGLGKGLDAIFAENNAESAEGAVSIRISEIEQNREQPRKEFDSEALSELADSISQHGVLQPLLLRPMLSGGYRIVAGCLLYTSPPLRRHDRRDRAPLLSQY